MIPFAKGISYQGKLVNDLGRKGTTGNNPPKRSGDVQRVWSEYQYSTRRRNNAKASGYRKHRNNSMLKYKGIMVSNRGDQKQMF